MNLKLGAKFQSCVTLSSGEGRGEVLKAEFSERWLDVRDQILPNSDLTPACPAGRPNPSPEERVTLDFNVC